MLRIGKNFKVGLRVRIISSPYPEFIGRTGIINQKYDHMYYVIFDRPVQKSLGEIIRGKSFFRHQVEEFLY